MKVSGAERLPGEGLTVSPHPAPPPRAARAVPCQYSPDMPLALYLLAAVCLLVLFLLSPDRKTRRCGQLIPGPRPYPFVGNIHELRFGYEGSEIYKKMRETYGDVIRLWLGYKLVVVLSDPDDAEILFRDTQNLSKSELYNFFHPWLGTGLLTSTGYKWHLRRKAITPTFHFKVLDQFLEVFERKSQTFVKCLSKMADGKVFDVHPLVSRFSLDVICESAMGVSLNAQTDDEPYVEAIRSMCDILSNRIAHIWLHPDILFNSFKEGKIQKRALSVIHKFTKKVMAEKEKKLANDSANLKNGDDELGIKKKTAFLELLMKMRAEKNSAFVTEEDIREEVDTFMFEGHDTTASAISFALHSLGMNPDVQARAFAEVKEVFDKHEGPLTIEVLNNLSYLERVIKETLRLYPSVPLIAREISQDIDLPSGYKIPVGAVVGVVIGGIHLNSKYYPEPEKFDPDRFLPENIANRHPYSYVPFSAGPRNCIGQKFAMLEMKACLSQVLLNFEIGSGEYVMPGMIITLQSDNGHQISLTPRKASS